MKARPQDLGRHLKALNPSVTAILIHGGDEGLVAERAERIVAQILGGRPDPMLLCDLDPNAVAAEPSLVHDELAEASLFGGRKLVRLRDANDGCARAAGFAIEAALPGFLLVTAGDLKATSALRKAFEQAPSALAIACYADDNAALNQLITEVLDGLAIDDDARRYLLANLGADRRLSRRELEKLALYMADRRDQPVRRADAIACVADNAGLMIDEIAAAAMAGDGAATIRLYQRTLDAGTSPIAVLRALQRRLGRLYLAAALRAQGMSVDAALAEIKPKIFWKEMPSYQAALNRWPLGLLGRAIELALAAEIECKTTGVPADAACGRSLMRLAMTAMKV